MTSIPLASVADTFANTASSGPLLLALGVCVLVGLVSFASPCVVPLVPGYLSYLAGLVGAEAPAVVPGEAPKKGRMRVLGAALLFVFGFTVVYVLMTVAFFGLTGALYNEDRLLLLQRIGGVVVILMGLIFLGAIPMRDRQLPIMQMSNWIGAPLLGAVFAIGWIPCSSATLSAVLLTAQGTEGMTVFRGTLLVAGYCFGLGLPFLILAFSSAWAVRSLGFLRRNARVIQLVGGALMIVVGVLLLFGWWNDIIDWIRMRLVFDMELPI
ncbi:cytochrome c biogenesis CcdA family protein [Gordonia sp. PP30]|uniref:cytochrome c biogenesis CcdA family protein n=1 Tax=unclassified Gordonia (in: high G+C Gram-positive bacteria) TaxID=2657482 RepID=UPI001FFE3C4F|nr:MULTISPECIES: cytochrome c biogenesis CcdA family protein [unclassified Gordonia (in: high G+C Gram-positive bacteria)]UQE74596.1 cytochrome c biogenesis CcdA family protein [Gordonia sp. PP30]